jgi:hypothetical protein
VPLFACLGVPTAGQRAKCGSWKHHSSTAGAGCPQPAVRPPHSRPCCRLAALKNTELAGKLVAGGVGGCGDAG